ncbi:glycosyltransferase family 4 protein [Saccharicrinis aurantiacus]|uniref:glycosyltransferase family 4 protein n=1 Tax=Saccharicrinis aurantiacus TaxID=1849719 RepID=UPI0024901F59|nr:glycosyltransferase family 1 protein [Saccharicrinis aurantiacus]
MSILKTKSITIDARMINESGIGRYIREVIDGIIEAFASVHLIVNNTSDAKFYLKYDNVALIQFKYSIYSPIGQLLLPFKVEKCDVFWAPHFASTFMPVRAKYRVTTIHDAFHLANRNYFSYVEYLYAKILYWSSVRLSNKVITVSNFSKKELVKYLGFNDKIEVVYNGVDFNKFNSKINDGANKIAPITTGKYLLCVGNVKPHKNLKVVIDAFFKCNNNLTLVIVGKKEGFIKADKNLRDLVEGNERVKFTGFVDDEVLVALYQNTEAFIFPSLYEGFGLPPLEALSANARVICSRAQPMPEVCGDYVEFFDPFDANKLRDLIELTPLKTSSKDTQEYVKKFDWKVSQKQHITILKELFA